MKATRRITHFKRLKDVGEETGYFAGVAGELGERLGAVLFQFPPTFEKDLERLRTFVDLLPDRLPAALEFRHDSWFDDEVRDCLRSRSLALCFAHEDDDTAQDVERRFAGTADWGYLRLRGSDYSDEEMTAWAGAGPGAGLDPRLRVLQARGRRPGPEAGAAIRGGRGAPGRPVVPSFGRLRPIPSSPKLHPHYRVRPSALSRGGADPLQRPREGRRQNPGRQHPDHLQQEHPRWSEMLAGDEVQATAILDRLFHYCHVLQIDGRSFRLRDMEQQLAQDR